MLIIIAVVNIISFLLGIYLVASLLMLLGYIFFFTSMGLSIACIILGSKQYFVRDQPNEKIKSYFISLSGWAILTYIVINFLLYSSLAFVSFAR